MITGDTGAGKTSLLDAISFALFNRTPEQRRARDLLTLGKEHGEVRLTFAARGEVWRVTRRYGTDAPEPAHLLERLEADGGASVETIGGEDAVAARLAPVVGMSFTAFTSAVLLAQGRFAEFLGAAPKTRDDILRELFGVASLEGARQAAARHSDVAAREADLREGDAAALSAGEWPARSAAARAARAAGGALAAARSLAPLAARQEGEAAQAAEARAKATAARAAAAELPTEDDAGALLARLAGARTAATQAEAARAEAAARHDADAAARDAARARHGGAGADLAALRERAARAEALAAELPQRAQTLDAADAALAARTEALEGLRRALTEAEATHEAATARAAALAGWAAAASDAAAADEASEQAARRAREASAARERADAAAREAEAAHEAARRHDLALSLLAGLAPGDPCPVCGGTVGEHPPEVAGLRAGDDDLAAAREAARAAGSAEGGARERAAAAAEAAAAAAGRRDEVAAALATAGIDPSERPEGDDRAAARQRAIADARAGVAQEERATGAEAARIAAERARLVADRADLATARSALGAWGAHESPVAALTAATEEVRAAEGAADASAGRVAAAATRAAESNAVVAAIEAGPVAALRSTAARVAARGGLEAPGDDLAAEDLVPAALGLRGQAEARAVAHEGVAAAAEGRAARAAEELAAGGAALGVGTAGELPAAVRRLERARDAARARWSECEGAAAEARRLRALAAAAREAARAHAQVANDLRANGFPRYLLGRFRERLAVGASARLQDLSGGHFRFSGAGPDPLAVVDQRRGERTRPASSLSGGERFLASLALALGLGDVAAESGGRLDCLFLDEGFSTLDAESLEQALAGIERLAGDGRLVGVITHLPGVAERLGAVIDVRKDPAGVSRIAGP